MTDVKSHDFGNTGTAYYSQKIQWIQYSTPGKTFAAASSQ
jgi:hypothetical protein